MYIIIAGVLLISIITNIFLFINMSKCKKSGPELAAEKFLLQKILESTADGIVVVVDATKEIIKTNNRFREIWGIIDERSLFMDGNKYMEHARELFDDPLGFHREMDEIIEKQKEYADFVTLKDGRVLERYYIPFVLHNDLKCSLFSFRDISATKKAIALEEEVKAHQKLLDEIQQYDKLKTHFFSIISHEFRTPLNIILGAIQLLNINHSNIKECPNYKYTKRHMEMMKQNCYRLLRLINNLIDITKMDAGFMNMEFRNRNIVKVIEDISVSVAEYAKFYEIELVFDTEVEEKIIACDADKLERVMLNLLSNALKFTDKGGRVYINIFDNKDSVIISVKDTGIGIPEKMKNAIFDRFRQVDSSFRRKREGSGIGLSLVKLLVEAHGGEISVQSELGKGTEFIIKLPVNAAGGEATILEEAAVAIEQDNVERINVEFSDIYS
ncbi:MAG TPA: PAS domain-containing sensor histidine kinase [Patescibacteria group bacterium]|nr:PAS domain-containing sensor histidine kinase [Patescibacteria group bacterium]